MDPADLADAVAVYQSAGYAALEAQAATHGWYQVRIPFTDWDTAEHTAATSLGPYLEHAEDTGVLGAWWFIRKFPCWRLRCRPSPAVTLADVQAAITIVLDSLTAAGLIDRWWETVYEPEACAFGGSQGMEVAHGLFHADSRGILDYLRRRDPTTPPDRTIGRRELSVLLCSALFRGAGQEWHEQGDVWHRVAQMRPLAPDMPTERLRDMTAGLQRLMTVDPGPTLFSAAGLLAFAAPWVAAFEQAGRRLGGEAHDGTLQRGVRDVLAHHVIFHWNRVGLTSRTQAILARTARDIVMNPPATLPDAHHVEG
ncbi:thiopeptide-type bacteriocin biosynthesis protein [Sphaerisporangium sp. NPDC088356]|uniref:thiopeptide-type bacteriocin biosynthesis protein n=1 Tax=Sphaerisporangium sp. NPDC088356 TaxID=3154871 RepID=UPI00343DA2DC